MALAAAPSFFLANAGERGELCKCIHLALLCVSFLWRGGGGNTFLFRIMYHQCHIKLQSGRGCAIGEILAAALPSPACQQKPLRGVLWQVNVT